MGGKKNGGGIRPEKKKAILYKYSERKEGGNILSTPHQSTKKS